MLFNKNMAADLAKLVVDNSEKLYPPKGSVNYRQTSLNAWESITQQLNATHQSNLTVWQVRTKVAEMKRGVRKDLADSKKQQKVTGDDPAKNRMNFSKPDEVRAQMKMQEEQLNSVVNPGFDHSMPFYADPIPSGNYIQGRSMMVGPQQQMAPYQQ
jgi:hypothetical protein